MTLTSDRLLNRLFIAASLGLVLMVAVTTSAVAWPRMAGALGIEPPAPAPQPPAYVAGQQIDVPAAWYSDAPRTLVVFAREACGACQKAQPFLKSLVAGLSGRASIVMAHPATTATEDAVFARAIGVSESSLHAVTAGLRVKATPTIVLVDQRGAILAAWEGAGKEDKQAEISSTIERLVR
ncbi:MAG TPA: hypothetical protein VN700_07145 [Vicinamibacterales bacterium]|nr:hypothetical protein [Vicinamibacterales bacterium]